MRLTAEHRVSSTIQPQLVELVTPRINTTAITPTENLLAALSCAEPFSLEIVVTRTARRFLARAGSATMLNHLAGQLAVAYPQAEIYCLDRERNPSLDPAALRLGEQVVACRLGLRRPPYLPLRTFDDAEVEAARHGQADPVLGILGALANLPEGWRGLAQLILRPAPNDWAKPFLRLAVEHPLASERAAAHAQTSLRSVVALAGALVAGVLAYQGYHWYEVHDWLHLGLLIGGFTIGGLGIAWLGQRLTNRPLYDVRLVQEKISRPAYVTELRLAVFAPATTPRREIEARVKHLVAAYHQFNLAAGNGFVACHLTVRNDSLTGLKPLGPIRSQPVLTTRELAGIWHLPQAQADVPFLERTTARQRPPLPGTVAHGCRIGVSSHQGQCVPVALPDDLLRRHLLLVAKTRRGKSSLLLQLAQHAIARRMGGRTAVVLVDPHRDLARAALGLVPADRWDDVVFLDVGERARPFGLNLLDVGLFPDRDKAVANALAVFRREFTNFWGPRMEDAFRFALLTLYEVNRAICVADPDGRARQHTVLDVPHVLVDTAFRRGLIGLVADPVVKAWWVGYFDLLDRRLQIEIANPVQTKVQRFAGSRAARVIVGQPCSTVDPGKWIRDGSIVIIDTAKGMVGEDTAALVGATLLNLVALAINEQAALDPVQRRPVLLFVDEFHSMPGADYEAILSELAKYGANLVLATQSLAKLSALDRERHRALRATVFANLDGLFAFNCSAEDARYLIPELGPEVDEQDLIALGDHQCYARISTGGQRLPVFSVRLDPPPPNDPRRAAELAAASALRYGRNATAVERDLKSALARIELSHRALIQQSQPGLSGTGVAKGVPGGTGDRESGPKRARNDHRPAKRKPKPGKAEAHQGTLFEVAPPNAGPPADGIPPAKRNSEARGEEELPS